MGRNGKGKVSFRFNGIAWGIKKAFWMNFNLRWRGSFTVA